MDATARFGFWASDSDELSFRKGSTLKILNMEENEEWWKAELDHKTGLIPANYIEPKFCNWYRGKVSRAESEEILSAKPNGGFLVRASESSPGDFSLSVKDLFKRYSTNVQHFRIFRDEVGKYFLWIIKFNSINDLVDYHRVNTLFTSDDVVLIDVFPKYVKALFDFQSRLGDELSFQAGDVILLSNDSNCHWWQGSIDGRQGQFPATYVAPYNPFVTH